MTPCTGATLDVGCGPGRLLVALQRARDALAHGIDVSAAAVARARASGVSGDCADVFSVLPAATAAGLPGRGWAHVLLADGNIGIGGQPRRAAGARARPAAPSGRVHVELDPAAAPDPGVTTRRLPLQVGGRDSTPLPLGAPWAPARRPARPRTRRLRLLRLDRHAGRQVAVLAPAVR